MNNHKFKIGDKIEICHMGKSLLFRDTRVYDTIKKITSNGEVFLEIHPAKFNADTGYEIQSKKAKRFLQRPFRIFPKEEPCDLWKSLHAPWELQQRNTRGQFS